MDLAEIQNTIELERPIRRFTCNDEVKVDSYV